MRACLTFIGDIFRDSRALRFIDALSPDYEVHAITASDELKKEQQEQFFLHSFSSLRHISLTFALFDYYRKAIPLARKIKADIYIASDLYSLPVASAGAKENHAKLVYDSRELYSSIAALHERKITQRFWSLIENHFVKHASVITTVNQSIANILKEKFPLQRIEVIHNYPIIRDVTKTNLFRETLSIPSQYKILLSQGGLQKGRGAFIIVDSLKSLTDCVIVFLGSGKLKEGILSYAKINNVIDRVYIHDAVRSDELPDYTASADIGLCIIENLGMSYYLSLPNKLFEYIAAGIPVVGSDFPEIKNVIEKNKIGLTVSPNDIEAIVSSIRKLLDEENNYHECVNNCTRVKNEFDWKNDRPKLQKLLS